MISALKMTPGTVPRPPRKLVPPTTQAATASNSIRLPTVDVEAPERDEQRGRAGQPFLGQRRPVRVGMTKFFRICHTCGPGGAGMICAT